MSKKIINCFLVFTILLFIGCKEDISDFAGVYKGTLSSQNLIKDDVELLFEVDASNKETLLFSGHALTHEEDGHYSIAEKEALLKIVNMLYPRRASNSVFNTSAVFVFEKKELTMQLDYNTEDSEILTIRFIGERK